MNLFELSQRICSLIRLQRYDKKGALAKTFSERPDSYSEKVCLFTLLPYYKFGLILLHSEMGGTMFSVTSSSRILHRYS